MLNTGASFTRRLDTEGFYPPTGHRRKQNELPKHGYKQKHLHCGWSPTKYINFQMIFQIANSSLHEGRSGRNLHRQIILKYTSEWPLSILITPSKVDAAVSTWNYFYSLSTPHSLSLAFYVSLLTFSCFSQNPALRHFPRVSFFVCFSSMLNIPSGTGTVTRYTCRSCY